MSKTCDRRDRVYRLFRNEASMCVGLFALLGILHISATLAKSAPKGEKSAVLVKELKTEHLVEPLNVESPHPRFRWLLDSAERGQLQTAYQVLVASSLETLKSGIGDRW